MLKINSKTEFEKTELIINQKAASTVILTSGGYPEKYKKGHIVNGIENIEDVILFHAGLKEKNKKYVTNGGRVLAITGQGRTLNEALKKSYKNIKKIIFKDSYFRKDIGFDVV